MFRLFRGTSKWIQGLGCLLFALTVIVVLSTRRGNLWLWKPDFNKGVVLGVFEVAEPLPFYRTELIEIHHLGANSISLPVFWFQEDVYAAGVHPYSGNGFDQALYDEQIRTVIAEAHDLGLKVFLMPIVQLENMGQGQWRGTLQPVNWDMWFASYEVFILHYAHLAADTEVELFSVGSELASTEGFRPEWTRLIRQVRAVYQGKLTYSANWDHYREVAFWNELDFLGLSGYYNLSSEIPVTYAGLHQAWQAIRANLLRWQQAEGKLLIFTEIGYPSQASAARSPWDYTAKGYPDAHLQVLCYRAFIETWKETPELAGTYLWIWEAGKGGPADRGYTWRGKPAHQEIESWYHHL